MHVLKIINKIKIYKLINIKSYGSFKNLTQNVERLTQNS